MHTIKWSSHKEFFAYLIKEKKLVLYYLKGQTEMGRNITINEAVEEWQNLYGKEFLSSWIDNESKCFNCQYGNTCEEWQIRVSEIIS